MGKRSKKPTQSQAAVAKNVVIFGETGVGKSSLVNMIAGADVASIGSGATGCTFQSASYTAIIDGVQVCLHDTVGLNEGQSGTVAARDAIIALYKLLDGLEDGVSLLVYCMRGRIKSTTAKNYRLFYDGLCQRQVPIVLVMTGLELEVPMDSWWTTNKHHFQNEGMVFAGQACITSTKGKEKNGVYVYEEEYEESRVATRELIRNQSRKPWKMEKVSVVKSFLKKSFNMFAGVFGVTPYALCRVLCNVLQEYGGFTEKEAVEIANEAARQSAGAQKKGDGEMDDSSGSLAK